MDAGPLYRRIASRIEADIAAGRLKTGDRIPAERVLADELGVSRMTARQALKQLSDKGLIEARTGQGTFVGQRRIEQKLETLTGFTEEMAQQGRLVSSLVLASETRPPDATAAAALRVGSGAQVHRLMRVRFADGDPVALETTEVLAAAAPGLLDAADFSRESLYAILRDSFGVIPTEAEQTLAADVADLQTSRTLRVEPGAPVLRLTRLTRDQHGRAFEFVRSVYRGDFFVMKVNLALRSPKVR
jgi:GntR family transcriptional regulator